MMSKLYTSREIKRGFMGLGAERPKAKPGQALVLTGGGSPIVLRPGQQATAGEGVWGGYDTIYEVDMGLKELSMNGTVPAQGGDVSFRFTLSIGYKVSDPLQVINEQIADAGTHLNRVLLQSIRQVTENFDIEQVQGASQAIREMLQKNKLSTKVPFELSNFDVHLELDDKAREFLQKRRDQKRQAILAQEGRDLTEATGQANQLKQQYDLDLKQKQNQFSLELEKQKVQMEIEIQRMRLEVYKPMIEGGMWSMLVQRLAQNPDDIDKVTDVIMQMHAQQTSADVEVLQSMIASDLLEGRHLKVVAENLMRSMERNMRGGPMQLPGEDRKRLTATEDTGNVSTKDDKQA